MTYTHLTSNELAMIEAYFHQDTAVAIVAKQLKRSRQAIYNVYNFLKQGKNVLEYLEQYNGMATLFLTKIIKCKKQVLVI